MSEIIMLGEWEHQEFVQLVFPHKKTDWIEYFDDAIDTFVNIANSIRKYQKVLIVANELLYVKSLFKDYDNLQFVKLDSNDTWARDFGGITVKQGDIYLMPMGDTASDIDKNSLSVIELCIKKGFKYSDRLHIRVWDNKRGV